MTELFQQKRTWWKEAVVYQVYPRSFCDGNGDGIGDLKGVIDKVDYLKDLGVDLVWLNPIFKSPNEDGGYDISDYYSIQPEFGTMQDFDHLVELLHARGMKLIMDLVLNHSSDEHAWFGQSRKSKSNPYRDYYFWKPGKYGREPNNWPPFFGGSAWQLDPHTQEYYLHLFSSKQPDLNWESPALRQELKDIMHFWLRKGVDGLRLDVISAISKRTEFSDTDTNDFNETIRRYYANGPRLKEFIAEMRYDVWDHYDCMTVGEGPGITTDNAQEYLNDRDGLNMIFHFGHMFIDQGPGGRFDPVPYSFEQFKDVFLKWDRALRSNGWGSVFLGNHDFARMVSRWGNDRQFWSESAKLLSMLLLSMRGTPFIFQGDEIGMTNLTLQSVDDSKDVETINGWRVAREKGLTEAEFMAKANYAGRDNARTPMQWTNGLHAGFSPVDPWMTVNANKESINVVSQQGDPGSVLEFYKTMIRLRKGNPVLVYGDYHPIESGSERLFGYYRTLENEKWLVLLNFSDESVNFPNAHSGQEMDLVLSNYSMPTMHVLRPWEARLYRTRV